MARHRSPSGRRAHLGSPLSVALAAAGTGGGARAASSSVQLTSSVPLRIVATAVAGGALAAAGQQVLASTLPGTVDAAIGLLSSSSHTAALDVPAEAAPLVGTDLAGTDAKPASAVDPVPAELPVADAASLVKAADLHAAAAAEAAKTAAAAAAAAEPAQAAQADAPALASVGGGVQMIVGPVTSGFGGRWGTTHQGLDIAAPIGTPIHVPEAGTVISSGPASGFGLWVRVQHDDGTITVYGHINRSLVKVGQRVNAGDVIAETGNRGQSTGPHLHIGVMVDGKYVNPQPWLDEHGIGY